MMEVNDIQQDMKDKKEEFDYGKAVEELEAIAAKAEDPGTGLDDIDRYISRSKELVEACRTYLRTARDKASSI